MLTVSVRALEVSSVDTIVPLRDRGYENFNNRSLKYNEKLNSTI